MKNMMNKSTIREIKGSFGRWISILAIVALGVGFFSGLQMCKDDFVATAEKYVLDQNLFNFQLISTLGLEDEDVEKISEVDGVKLAEGSVSTDALVLVEGDDSGDKVVKFHTISDNINKLSLVYGSMPEEKNQCVVDARYFTEDALGTNIQISNSNEEDTVDMFSCEEYEIVGIANSPTYMNQERGSTSLGSGSVSFFAYIPAEGFDCDVYTEIYVDFEDDYTIFSDEYDKNSSIMEDRLTDALELCGERRYDSIVSEAQEKVDEAQAELEDAQKKLADAQAELEDGRTELNDAQKELDDGLKKLDDAQKELNDGKNELDKAQTQLNDARQTLDESQSEVDEGRQEIYDGQKELNEAQAEVDKNKADLDTAREQLVEGQAQVDAGREELAAAKAELEAGQAELSEGKAQLEEARAQLETAKAEVEAGEAALQEGKTQLAAARTEYEAGVASYETEKESAMQQLDGALAMGYMTQEQYDAAKAQAEAEFEAAWNQLEAARLEIEAGEAQLAENEAQLTAAKAELEAAQQQLEENQAIIDASQAELDAGRAELEAAEAQLDASQEEINKGLAELESGEAQLADAQTAIDSAQEELNQGLKDLEEGQKKIDDGRRELSENQQKINDGYIEIEEGQQEIDENRQKLIDGQKEIDEGWEELEDGQAEIDENQKKLDDAKEELADAQKEIDDIKKPDNYVLGRNTNIGYTCFENDSQIIVGIAKIFPVFFFLVAALVCMTTMTRMIDDQRTQIGVLKALGYDRRQILKKYTFYSGSASVLGTVIGYFSCIHVFPYVVWDAYGMMYGFADIIFLIDWPLFILSMAAALLCSVGTTIYCCSSEMKEVPAQLIRPKTPKAGKRIFLEYVPFIWNKLGFLIKVSIRNTFRYKKRFFMMVLGISGCTALLITGLGVRDSIGGIVYAQYDEIYHVDYTVSFEEELTTERQEVFLTDSEAIISGSLFVYSSSVDITTSDATKSVNLIVCDEDDNIGRFIVLHNDEGSIAYPGTGQCVINSNLADILNLQVGDTINAFDSDMNEIDVTISAICDNYVNNYIYINESTYEEQVGPVKQNTAFVLAAEGAEETPGDLLTTLVDMDNVSSVSATQEFIDRINTMLEGLNIIVGLIVVCAGALAFIVLYNLTNINITERIREIATIKVLGFQRNETASYVFRENILLTAIAALAGMPLGKALLVFVMSNVKIDAVSFAVQVKPLSYVLGVVITFIFAFMVNLVMQRKIEKISMTESLKSIE